VNTATKSNNFFWPKITDLPSATAASDLGFWAAVAVATITTVFATIALVANTYILAIDAWAYFDAVLFALIAWRIRRRSGAFAVAGLCLFIFEKLIQFSQPEVASSGAVMALLFLLFFINGVRGTFAFHRYSREEAPAGVAQDV